MTFAEKLRLAMRKANITQAELARRAKISTPLVNNYLKGNYKAKQINIYKLAKALNIPEYELLEDYIPMFPVQNTQPLSDDDKELLEAYHKAPDNLQKSIDVMLEPYKSKLLMQDNEAM